MRRSPLLLVCLRYGAVAGVLAVVMLIILYYSGRNPMLISPFLDFRILLFGIFIFFSLKEVRDYYQEGVLYFWQGIIGSFMVVLLASIIGAAGLMVFGKFEPGLLNSYVKEMAVYLKSFPQEDIDRIGKEVYDRNLAQLPATNIWKLAITYFAQGLVIGFFVSIVLSVVLRRQPKN